MNNVYNGTGPDATEATLVTYNKNLFRLLQDNLDKTQDFIFGLNFGTKNKTESQVALAGSVKYMDQARIYAYELGNEINYYSLGYRSRNWTYVNYAQEQLEWLTNLSETDPSASYQFGNIVGPPKDNPDFTFQRLASIDVPMNIPGVKILATHAYPKNICTPQDAAQATMEYFLDHTSTKEYVSSWQGEIATSKANGYLFHVGEMSGVACHGKKGLSDTHGALLWSIDFALAGASLGMDRVFFHNGKGEFYYNMWEPTDSIAPNGTVKIQRQVRPLYYSTLFLTDLVHGISKPKISSVSSLDAIDLANYAVFNHKGDLKKMVVINTQVYEDTNLPRQAKALDLKGAFGRRLRITRLTAPSVTSTSETTWAGQSTDADGRLRGEEITECSEDGLVRVYAGDAVIVEAEKK
ncbi:hypothetical protein B9Z65_8917 [Elsinoe australis]|uniref:Beta-glucuronidase C-terminal domain-containing protein n=1 Tax=Elsinoe australis TaxID=40998 RepID=A0A2P7YF55_9PEZI|nr:hypothetical protein B9Z65_8917 [Elsinoe australis]